MIDHITPGVDALMKKTPDEIKRGLECCGMGNRCKGHCPYGGRTSGIYECTSKLSINALAYIQQLEQRVPRWISVEERLPEEDEDVLVFAIGDLCAVIAITSYSHNLHGLRIDGWRPPWEYFRHNYKITHWMPLPEPPEEKKEDTHE